MADISQIRKYLNGELDARAMHRLERQAQDDPFLMDALEGYQNTRSDQQANLDDLAARLNRRVSKKEARIIPLRMIGIAASILIVCSAGVWWLYQGRGPVKNAVKNEQARTTSPVAAEQTARAKPAAAAPVRAEQATPVNAKPATPSRQVAVNAFAAQNKQEQPPAVKNAAPAPYQADAKATPPVAQDTTPLNEMIVMNYSSAKKKDTARSATLREVSIKTAPDTAPMQRLQAQVPGVKIYPGNKSQADLNKLLTNGSLGAIGNKLLTTNQVIEGRVIAENSGAPIKGATVKVAGTSQMTKTDSKGNFKLRADTNHANLEVATRGYQTRQVNAAAKSPDSLKTIALAPDNSDQLSETVVTGYTSQAKDIIDTYTAAHPQKGWSDLRKYLKTNAVSPDGVTGVVKVTFSVDRHGGISDIKVVKGLSAAANKKAVALVKDGPEWAGNSNRKPETVTLRIKFSK